MSVEYDQSAASVTAVNTSPDADADTKLVIAPHGDRLVLGEVIDREPRPTFPNPEREVLTVRVDETDTTIQVLASDAEPATDDVL